MIDKVERLIKRHEGLRHFVYKCPAGRYTVGYGRNIDVAGGKGISAEEADYLLQNDIYALRSQLMSAVPVFKDLDLPRQAVLVSMAYNLGIQGLLKFKLMLKALHHKSFATAADEMLDSKWARQVKGRATELAQMMSSGEFKDE